MQSLASDSLPRTWFCTYASAIPNDVLAAMMENEPAANTILAFAQKKALDASENDRSDDNKWFVQYDNANNVEFVLSCTKGPLGDYPIFIFSARSSIQLRQLEEMDIRRSLGELVCGLLSQVPPERVFSVFSIANIAEIFSSVFVEHVEGIEVIYPLYYDATLAICTSETLNQSANSFHLPENNGIVIRLRHADLNHDLDALAQIQSLCKGFSETSPPYVLDDVRAKLEAQTLIENQQVWVHLIGEEKKLDIACLVATTRESDNVTAITKVYTAEHWRKRGCAARLVHRVCEETLKHKQYVVLYVGNGDSEELAAARRAYRKVGFQGLDRQQGQPEGERWIEIGFSGTHLGYW